MWRGWPPLKWEKGIARRVRTRNVGAPANLGSFAPHKSEKRMMMKKLDRLAP
jgi:hypothetical protein